MGLILTDEQADTYFLIFKNFTANPSRFDQTTLPLILAVLAFFNGTASVIICPE